MVQLIELGNRSLLRILTYFLRNPSASLSYTQLRKKIKIAKATLTFHLKFLVKARIVTLQAIGLNKIYRLDMNNQVVRQLKVIDSLLLLELLKEAAKKYGVEIYLYGSASRGEDLEGSDIDLLVIGGVVKEKIFPEIRSLERGIGRKVNFIIFSQLEWSQMARKDAAFYERVEKDKVRIR